MATKLRSVLAISLVAFSLTACASARHPTGEINDPIEPVNRAIFGFNRVVDTVIIDPAARAYKFIVPGVVRSGVQSFFRNLRSPVVAANELLQGDIGGAGKVAARFVINTTVGIGGLIDVAEKQGLPYEHEDFGQTLAKWGVGDGCYLVLPIIGPSSLRDGTGLLVDTFSDPINIWAHNTDRDWITYTRAGVEGLDLRSRLLDGLDDMRRNSLDYYAAMRSAYSQKRAALIRDESVNGMAIPDYEDDF